MTLRLAATLAAIFFLALPAAAQPAAPATAGRPTAADRETARTLMNEGAKKLAAKDYQGAVEAFKAADDIMRVPTTGLELGRAQALLGKLLEARDTLMAVQNTPAAPGEAPLLAAARKQAAELAAQLAERIPSLTVRVVGPAAGTAVEVAIDAAPLPPSAARLARKLDPGEHTVVVTAAGFAEAKQVVTLAEREQKLVTIELRPEQPAQPSPVGPAPAAKPEPPPAKSAPPPVTFGPREPEPAKPEPSATAGISPLVWVGFGVGAAGLVTGTVTGILTLSQASDVMDQCPDGVCREAQREDYDGAMTLAHVSTAGFVVGAAGILAGAVCLTVLGGGADTEAPAAQTGLVLRPAVGPGTAGLVGRF
ncbi:MAG: hypothetical protein HY744_00310 [Deltaproteobacteria bacterium]|nr:hypothetical protein [Deltaproteobacteria bacterium]